MITFTSAMGTVWTTTPQAFLDYAEMLWDGCGIHICDAHDEQGNAVAYKITYYGKAIML